MSLFEKLKNKRYDLQEAPIDDKGMITPEPGEIKKSEKILKKFVKKQKKEEQKNIRKNTQQGDKLLQDINKRKSADLTRADAINRSMGTSGSTEGAGGANTGTITPKPKITGDVVTNKGVSQAEVSKQAKEFTNKINKQRVEKQKNIFGGEDDVKKREFRSTTSRGSRGTRTKTKIPVAQGQKKLDLGDYTKGQVQPTKRLSKSGEVLDDLRTVSRKRNVRKRSPLAKPPKPEKMVIAKDPIKGGFKKVGATTTAGREVIKKSVSTDELLKGQSSYDKRYKKEYKKAFNNKGKSGKTLFQRIKDIGRTSKKYLGKAHQFMIKDAGFRKTSEFAGYGRNITKNTFKNTMRGNTLRTINKYLPGKYKALAAIVAGTYLATRGKKGSGGGASGGGKKFYKAVEIPMGFDSKSASKKKIYDPKNK